MNLKQMAASAVLATAAVSAVAAESGHSKSGLPHPKFNPHPQEIYEITLTVHNAPGPIEQGGGFVAYRADSTKCVPKEQMPYNDSVAPAVYSRNLDLERASKNDDKAYKIIIALDLLVDDNHYGKEVCHWRINDIELTIGRDLDVSTPNTVFFDNIISQANIKTGHTVTTYFLKSDYIDPKHKTVGRSASVKQFTQLDYLNTPETERLNKFFSVTLTAKKLTPQPELQHLIQNMYWPRRD
jgi:hypothetical protein